MTLAKHTKAVADFARTLLEFGGNPNFSPWDNSKTYHLNLLLLVSTIGASLFAITNVWLNELTLAYCGLVIIVFNVAVFALQAINRPYVARTLTCLAYPALFFMLIYYGEGGVKGEYAFFLMVSLVVLFFRKLWRQIAMIAYVFLFFLVSQILLWQTFGAITDGNDIIINSIVFLAIAFGLVLITNSFIKQIISSDRKNRQLLTELAYSNEELKRLNYMVSHDLRTPLRQIVSFAKLSQAAAQQGEASSSTEYMSFIEDSARELYQMTESLLSLAHLDKQQLQKEHIDLSEIFAKLETQFSRVEEGRKVQIHAKGQAPLLEGNPVLIPMLLQNLVENGIKYNENTIKDIRLEAEETDDEVRVYVRDNGIGIAPGEINNIFTVFHRLDHHKYQGSGLGLAIAKKIMDIHGGKIDVVSSKSGSVFVLHFPKIQEKDLKHDQAAEKPHLSLKKVYRLSKQGRAIF